MQLLTSFYLTVGVFALECTAWDWLNVFYPASTSAPETIDGSTPLLDADGRLGINVKNINILNNNVFEEGVDLYTLDNPNSNFNCLFSQPIDKIVLIMNQTIKKEAQTYL